MLRVMRVRLRMSSMGGLLIGLPWTLLVIALERLILDSCQRLVFAVSGKRLRFGGGTRSIRRAAAYHR